MLDNPAADYITPQLSAEEQEELEERQLANEEEARNQKLADSIKDLIKNSGAKPEVILGALANLFYEGFPGTTIEFTQENEIVTLLERAIEDHLEADREKLRAQFR
jgi:hypothetical protein